MPGLSGRRVLELVSGENRRGRGHAAQMFALEWLERWWWKSEDVFGHRAVQVNI